MICVFHMERPSIAVPADVELSPGDILRLHEHLLDFGAMLDLHRLHLEILDHRRPYWIRA
jgi:hypothetical protein